MLKQRVLTALALFLGFMGALLGLTPAQFSALVALVALYGAWEWAALAGFKTIQGRALYVTALLLCLLAVARWQGFDESTIHSERARSALFVACMWWAIALLWVQGYPSSAILWGRRWSRALMGCLVLVPTWLAITLLIHTPEGPWLVLAVIALVAAADIGAFFFGRAFGRHKLALRVSPGKTWEGVGGGLVAITAIAVPAALSLNRDGGAVFVGFCLLLALLTGLASVLGDLVESMIKRYSGVKDSGRVLPGHGGVLDRIDGMTAALPVFALLYSLLPLRFS
ncbi:MAG TPA: phosphatidate cytidylyltransferase [Porticoccaceae bacterium]|nr:phosphatidate cytidylyltransferase [Porticoccaceae bacterium]